MQLAREFDLIASMHVGGGTSLTDGGFERLLQEDLVDRRLNVVHGNDIKPDTIRRMVDRGGTFTVTAEIELQMGYGDPLTGLLHALGAPVAIGTDVEPAVGQRSVHRHAHHAAARAQPQHHRDARPQRSAAADEPAHLPARARMDHHQCCRD